MKEAFVKLLLIGSPKYFNDEHNKSDAFFIIVNVAEKYWKFFTSKNSILVKKINIGKEMIVYYAKQWLTTCK